MINEEAVKDSFKKIKSEMRYLASEIFSIKSQIQELYDLISQISILNSPNNAGSNQSSTSATDSQQTEENPAQNTYYKQDLSLNYDSSIGNGGVPADRQQTVSRQIIEEKALEKVPKNADESQNISHLIDGLKNDLKQKFRSLTKQEFLIFSLIYSLTEEHGEANYKELALRSKLTESSVRDYLSRLEHKGIPLIKEKKNNKLVVIRVPKELRDIAALDSLVKLNKI
jgi:hypothetical protein